MQRDDPADDVGDPAARDLAGVLDAVLLELFDQLGSSIRTALNGLRLLGRGRLSVPRIAVVGDRHLLDALPRGRSDLKSL